MNFNTDGICFNDFLVKQILLIIFVSLNQFTSVIIIFTQLFKSTLKGCLLCCHSVSYSFLGNLLGCGRLQRRGFICHVCLWTNPSIMMGLRFLICKMRFPGGIRPCLAPKFSEFVPPTFFFEQNFSPCLYFLASVFYLQTVWWANPGYLTLWGKRRCINRDRIKNVYISFFAEKTENIPQKEQRPDEACWNSFVSHYSLIQDTWGLFFAKVM